MRDAQHESNIYSTTLLQMPGASIQIEPNLSTLRDSRKVWLSPTSTTIRAGVDRVTDFDTSAALYNLSSRTPQSIV